MAVKHNLATGKLSRRAKASTKSVSKPIRKPASGRSGVGSAKPSKANSRKRVANVRKAASQPRGSQAKPAGKTGKSSANGKGVILKNAHSPVGVVNGKAVRVEPKLNKTDLEHFRELLLEKRREILGDVGSMENEAFKNQDNHSSSPMHMADVGTDNFEQEFTLGLIESERQMLREIHEAIGRIEDGTYGVCAGTGKVISRARLEATPWAKYCIEYARMLESGLGGRDAAGELADRESSEEDED